MAGGFNAKRYAEAVFQIARERNELDKWQAELAELVKLREDAALAAWLDNPKVGLEIKQESLEAALKDISPLARNLVYLLIHRGRLNGLGAVAAAYEDRLNQHLGRLPAKVTSAAPLDAATEAEIKARLSAITGQEVIMHTAVDPALVGGFVARIGDKLLDGSTISNLRSLKRSIAENK
jgi:F-type H+-transporting ATPase subunit delta